MESTMPRPPNALVLYSDPSREAIIQSFNRQNSAVNMIPHRVDSKRSVSKQFKAAMNFIANPERDITGIIGTNDFASALAAAVSEEMGFTTPSLQSIYQAQHKVLFAGHAAACSTHFQPTCILTCTADIPQDSSWYPGFIKPAAGSLSDRAHMVKNPADLREKYREASRGHPADVRWREELFQPVIAPDDPPFSAFLLQPFYTFPQYTGDAYRFNGTLYWVGITASIFDAAGHSFERFDFPADIPAAARAELDDITRKITQRIGYGNGCLNVEFFITEGDHIALIELNTRQSLQFVPLFAARYTSDYLTEACRLALGDAPQINPIPNSQRASSCVLRMYADAKVVKVPTQGEIESVISNGLARSVRVLVQPGARLSDYKQDEYSYRYALINIMGKDTQEIQTKLDIVKNQISFLFR